ncbi:MAG: tyrosine-type recombinase/integrase, partial [Rhizobiaceae bacterium]
MPKLAMSAKWLDTVKPDVCARDYYDQRELGLVVRVSARGTKTFYFGYRSSLGGNQQKLKLGRYPDLSLADARNQSASYRTELANGNDLKTTQRDCQALTVNAIAIEYFSSAKFKRTSARHQYDCQRAIRKDVLVGLGQSIIGEVSRREWMDTVRNVEKRGSHAAAHQLFVYLKTFLNWAEDQGYLELNPIARAKYDKPAVRRQRKSLSEEDLKTFWNEVDRGRA